MPGEMLVAGHRGPGRRTMQCPGGFPELLVAAELCMCFEGNGGIQE